MADRKVVAYTNTPMAVDERDWCGDIGYFHAFERKQGTSSVWWACVYCGRTMVGRMPPSLRFYLIEEEPY